MQFSCEKCRTKYAVPDDKVRGKRIRTRCRKCGADIFVEGPADGEPGQNGTPSDPPGGREDRWTVAFNRTDQRKMTTAEVVAAYSNGEMSETTLVWKQGMQSWQPPFEIPVIALALRARGHAPTKVSDDAIEMSKSPTKRDKQAPVTAAPPPSPASDWDSEDEATKVVDSSLRFPGRPSRTAAAPPAPPRPAKPPLPPKKEPAAVPPAPPAQAFDFDDEATAVIAPDRAKALLEAEANKRNEPATAPPPPDAALAVSFEDEATRVYESTRPGPLVEAPGASDAAVDALIEAPPSVLPKRPSPPPKPAFPIPKAAPVVVLPSPVVVASGPVALPPERAPAPGAVPPDKEPSVVVSLPSKSDNPPPPPPAAAERQAASPPPSPSAATRDLSGIQNERTRVIRAVTKPKPKKDSGVAFWIFLFIALAAAAAGGFIASERLQHHSLPSFLRNL